MKKIIEETIEKDYTTGEIKVSSKTTQFKSDEPNYVKLYLDDISYLNRLTPSSSSVLYELLNYTTYKDHNIVLNSYIKNEIAKKIKTTLGVINNNITKLVNKKILNRVGRGTYILSPFLFGKGDWKSIRELRNQNIEMKIIYNCETNEREISTEIAKQPSLPFEIAS